MTRVLLTWLAFATLPLGATRGGSGAELRSGGESTHSASQLGVFSRDELARIESRSEEFRPIHTPPLASAGAARLRLQSAGTALPAQRPVRSAPLSRSRLLPEPRAPPA